MRGTGVYLGGLLTLLAAAPAAGQSKDITVEAMRSEKRVALVIGNANYLVGRLNNPVLDARAMAQALRALGFEVLSHENLAYQGMRRAVADFGERIAGGGVGLFYYSGHGLQVNGKNYLVPVDTPRSKASSYVAAETVDVDSVLAQMQEPKTRINIVVLGTTGAITSAVPRGTLEDPTVEALASCAAGPGSTTRSICGRRPAATSRRSTGATTSGSVARGGFPKILTSDFWILNSDVGLWRQRAGVRPRARSASA